MIQDLDRKDGRSAIYHPFVTKTFVDQLTRSPVITAVTVQLDEFGVTYAE